MTYRVMAIQETGEECCLAAGVETEDEAYIILAMKKKELIEYRSFWVEFEQDRFQILADIYKRGDEDLY